MIIASENGGRARRPSTFSGPPPKLDMVLGICVAISWRSRQGEDAYFKKCLVSGHEERMNTKSKC